MNGQRLVLLADNHELAGFDCGMLLGPVADAAEQPSVAAGSNGCYARLEMTREISVRELRNHTATVVAAVRAGERLSLTVNRTPVADIVPHQRTRSPWVASETLRLIVDEAGADAGLLEDLGGVRDVLLDDE